jgi:hypothetical protein
MTYCMSKNGIKTGVNFDERPAPQLETEKPIVLVTDSDLFSMTFEEIARLFSGNEYVLAYAG